MKQRRDRVSHLVQVARIRIETTVVEIEGEDIDDAAAELEAIEEAELLPNEAWVTQPFDGNSYRPHVQSLLSREEIDELAEAGQSASAELDRACEPIRYLLLKANCGSGEGELVLQPWLVADQPDLLASDLCRAWLDALKELGLTHLSERLHDLAAVSPPLPSDQVLFNVQRRAKPKE